MLWFKQKKRISETYTSTIHNTYKILRCVCFSIHPPNKTAHICLCKSWNQLKVFPICSFVCCLISKTSDVTCLSFRHASSTMKRRQYSLDKLPKYLSEGWVCLINLWFRPDIYLLTNYSALCHCLEWFSELIIAIYASIQFEYLQNQDY